MRSDVYQFHILAESQPPSKGFDVRQPWTTRSLLKPNKSNDCQRRWLRVTQVMKTCLFCTLSCEVPDYRVWGQWATDSGPSQGQESCIPLIKANRQQLPGISREMVNNHTASNNDNSISDTLLKCSRWYPVHIFSDSSLSSCDTFCMYLPFLRLF